ncbi:MAG: pectate lyase [Bacteroidales bacterium]|nr:pectate lyase [Bacteroidales bacterium]
MKRNGILLAFAVMCAFVSCGGNGNSDVPVSKAPAVPSGITLHSKTETSLSFQWDAVSDATGYEWKLLQGSETIKEGTSVNRNAVIYGLTKNTTYKFAVRSVAGDQHSEYSSFLEATTEGQEEPPVPPQPPVSKIEYSEFKIPAGEEDGVPRAFPGAEGGGAFVTGGRGGQVIHVTNLNDSGGGSLRAALNTKGPRTIVFDVVGIIELKSTLKIESGYGDVTIAGQTAPGKGICLKNYTFRINASNVIIRFIHCRMGDECKTEDDAMNLYTSGNDIQDVIIDHCSLSWSTDECGSFYGMTNFSLQWCILSEGLRNSIHGKGKHGYGGIWGGANATYHHNILAHHDSRNPRFDHDYVSTLKGPVDFVNNVIYNWGDNSSYGGESANETNTYKQYNIVGNYYKPGPATASSKHRFIDPWTKDCSNCTKATGCSTIVPGHFYMTGNVMAGNDEADAGKTSDNWTGTTADSDVIGKIKSASPFYWSGKAAVMTIHTAEDAFRKTLDHAGASLDRDDVDVRIARETRNGTYTHKGSNGSTNGFIDSQSDAGGWPSYSATSQQLERVADSDKDGIPDYYEELFGLDKDRASDADAKSLDTKGRYTNLEMYLHYLVRDIISAQNEGGSYKKL